MRHAFLCLLLLLSACRKEQPSLPTPRQSGQLNEAEDMLNSMAQKEGPQNEEGPEQSPGPSNSSD